MILILKNLLSKSVKLLRELSCVMPALFLSVPGTIHVNAGIDRRVVNDANAGEIVKAIRPESPLYNSHDEVLFRRGYTSGIYLYDSESSVVKTALSILQKDVERVFDGRLIKTQQAQLSAIIAGTIDQSAEFNDFLKSKNLDLSPVRGKWEAFIIKRIVDKKQSKLLIIGSDSHGTAYGILELSRLIGVSPWEWWADAAPAKRDVFSIPSTVIVQSPSVQYRGIFLNDEDFALNPWSSTTYEKDSKFKAGIDTTKTRKMKIIGPATYARIFELLLRLRANTIWPAMHEVSAPFYFVDGNKEVAEKYGIYLGSAHCEPLARNSATEWDISGTGDYNYLTNRENIISYWEDRLKELKGAGNIFTIGMRGKHDGAMQGVRSTLEYKAALEKVIPDQQVLLAKYIHNNTSAIPQMLIPYKELLDVYNAGLEVPDHVTLMWCDDNYGYITHFPNDFEKKRLGGNGIYYHASYWGRPHDYLWLGTTSPFLLYHQMKLAYDEGAHKIWILNVGDIKPTEYQIELFLDMAWNIDKVNKEKPKLHLKNWLINLFGERAGEKLLPVMLEHYRLAYIRKPEFMANTREEEKDPAYKIVKDLPWTEEEIRNRIISYDLLSKKTDSISKEIFPAAQSAYFQLVKYPVQAAAFMNKKLLYAQLARHKKADWSLSHNAFDSITILTSQYNSLENGKWERMMNAQPRNLPVFQKVKEEGAESPLRSYQRPALDFNGGDYANSLGSVTVMEGLGYSERAVSLKKGNSVSYKIENIASDTIWVELRLVPNHPVNSDKLRVEVQLGETEGKMIAYHTKGRSEEWKDNVLRNQAIRQMAFPLDRKNASLLKITALDQGVIIDQVKVYKEPFQ